VHPFGMYAFLVPMLNPFRRVPSRSRWRGSSLPLRHKRGSLSSSGWLSRLLRRLWPAPRKVNQLQ